MPGTMELIAIFAVALIIFGPSKMPEIGKSIGKALREFNKAKNEIMGDLTSELQDVREITLTGKDSTARKSEETK